MKRTMLDFVWLIFAFRQTDYTCDFCIQINLLRHANSSNSFGKPFTESH